MGWSLAMGEKYFILGLSLNTQAQQLLQLPETLDKKEKVTSHSVRG